MARWPVAGSGLRKAFPAAHHNLRNCGWQFEHWYTKWYTTHVEAWVL